jgi:lipoprotein LpqH
MRRLLTVAAVAALAVAGCSSQPPPETRPGTLILGTARVTVNGTAADVTDQVTCTVAGHVTTIVTGTGQSGVTALVSDDGRLVAQSVRIRNLGGFTGDYRAGFGDPAEVTVTGRSFAISGSADGFFVSQPAIQTSGSFTIDVAC